MRFIRKHRTLLESILWWLFGYCRGHHPEWYGSIKRDGYWQKCLRCPKCGDCTRVVGKGEFRQP